MSNGTMGERGDLAIVMSGGGPRAAYQVGFLRAVAREVPDLEPEILTGVSAGAVNAAFLASQPGRFVDLVRDLAELWCRLEPEQVMNTRPFRLGHLALRWALRLASGGRYSPRNALALLDTQPLRAFLHRCYGSADGSLPGIQAKIDAGTLKAVAVTATSYSTGQSVTFYQGRDIADWERPNRRSQHCLLGVEHVMASSALPVLFPAVRLGSAWFGDGGMRLTSPLAPAIHFGARRILAISTRYARSAREADVSVIAGYPPPAQVASTLLNAVFLDRLDGDALRLQTTNELLERIPTEERGSLRPVELQIWRPSEDLGRLANEFEVRLPKALRFLLRGTGTLEANSNDLLSFIMFQSGYLQRLVDLGERDALANLASITRFLAPGVIGEAR